MNKYDLDTPVLMLDLDLLKTNLDRMAEWSKTTGCAVRPHFKAHRTLEIADLQLRAGAVGITCAKLDEAEILINHSVLDLLLANEVAGQQKIERLVELCRRSYLKVLVDNAEVLGQTAAAARMKDVEVPVLVEIHVGMQRAGVEPEEAFHLARAVVETEGVTFQGLAAYEGHLGGLPPSPEKEAKIREALEPLGVIGEQLEAAGITVPIVSLAGTGTYQIAGTLPFVTEVQPGTYAVGDGIYNAAGAGAEYAMTVLTTVASRQKDRLILDAGMKATHPAFGMPFIKGHPELEVVSLSAEHGNCRVVEECSLRPGDKVEIVPWYADGTINLWDDWVLTEGEQVVGKWRIVARGKSK